MVEHAPLTREGQAAWDACLAQGAWRQAAVVTPAGGTVVCTGLDIPAAIALADPAGTLDAERLGICLTSIETGRLAGQAKKAEGPDVAVQ